MMKFLLPTLSLLSILAGSPVSAQLSPVATSADEPAASKKAPADDASDYIRYVEVEGGTDLLQTALVRFRKGNEIVDLVGVVHLADAAYFENLNDVLKLYDVVLYEMMGGEFTPESGAPPAGVTADPAEAELGGIRDLQNMAKSFLGLEFQLDGIDYESPNFVHADVEWDGFQSLMEAKNQNLATFFTRAMSLSESGAIPGIPSDEAAISQMLNQLMSAVMTGDSSELKRTIAPVLSEAEGFITMLEGEDGTVLVTERNKVVMEKLSEVRAAGEGKYAVFYGAGHMPDLETRLLAEGFEKGEITWVDAWTMPESDPSGAGGQPASPADFLLQMLQENPEFMSTIQQLGEVIEELQKTE